MNRSDSAIKQPAIYMNMGRMIYVKNRVRYFSNCVAGAINVAIFFCLVLMLSNMHDAHIMSAMGNPKTNIDRQFAEASSLYGENSYSYDS